MPDRLAEYMVNLIPDDSIRSVVDLSMGKCGLLEEAKKDAKMLFYMVQI